MLATTFRRCLDRFVRAIRADLGAPDLPIVFGELPPAFVDADPQHAAIRDGLALAARRRPSSPSPRAARRASPRTTGLHYSTAGLLAIGGRYAGALAAAEAGAPAAAGDLA